MPGRQCSSGQELWGATLRRCAARRGTPCLIVTDNAKTFKATAKALNKLQNHPEIRNELDKLNIEWKFNLKRAPWWGGLFEIQKLYPLEIPCETERTKSAGVGNAEEQSEQTVKKL